MAKSKKNNFILGMVACAVALFSMSTLVRAEDQPIGEILQPQALNCVGIYQLRRIEPSLTGTDVEVAVICRSITYIDGQPQNDYRPSTAHNCFINSPFTFNDRQELPPGISPHSTAICSILFGEDPYAFEQQLGQFYYQGIIPAAEANIYEFWHFLINNVFPGLAPDADVITAGFGSQFEDWWTRGIESLAEQYGLIIVAGIGNGSAAYDPPLYPGAAANVIGVGVVNSVDSNNIANNLSHFALAYPEHSSFGPTLKGLSKPDIVAPGNCLAASDTETGLYEPTGNWSSFSTQLVAGTAALLVQKAEQDPNLSAVLLPDGGNCLVKAILLNSATKLPYWHKGCLQTDDDHESPLDGIQGAGMLNAVSAYEHLISGRGSYGDVAPTGWDLNHLRKTGNKKNIYKITLPEPADKIITTTVVWNKHFNSVYPFEPLTEQDSDLRLELWAVDTNNPGNDHLLDYSDSSADNLEHIYCKTDPNYTNYEIAVLFSDVNDEIQFDISEFYGLAWNVSEKQQTDNIFWYDINADGIVNELDVIVMLENWLTSTKTPESYILGDINTDGAIDVNDLRVLLDHANLKADWYEE
jgi:hypothetical protein